MGFCTYCGREFVRQAHLLRHMVTHSQVRAFPCRICGHAFSRSDVASKHEATHRDITASCPTMVPHSKSPKARPQFIPVACLSCAKSKTRCDHRFPCGRCSRKGITCVPRTPRRAGAGGLTVSAYPSSNAVVPADTSNDADVATSSAGIENSAGDIVGTPELRPATSPSQAEVTNPASQNDQHPSLQPGPEESNGLNSPNCALDTDFDMSLFLTLGDPELDGNLDWARFLDSVSSDLQLPGHVSADNGRHLSGFEIPTTVFATDSQLHHESGTRTSIHSSIDTGILSNRRARGGADYPREDQHSIQSSATERTIDNHLLSSRNDHNDAIDETDYWSVCQCTPFPADTAPIRSSENIAYLGENLGYLTSEVERPDDWRQQHFQSHELLDKVPLTDSTRERLLVVMQTFFRWTCELYGLNRSHAHVSDQLRLKLQRGNSIGFLLLPPTLVLHRCLEKFLTSFEPFYPIAPQMTLDPNTLVTGTSENISALLLALMIAYGMIRDEDPKGRRLSIGMIELCRVALTNFVEREMEMPRSRLTFHCALLWTLEAAFSGDKHLMDFSQGQRYNFLGMARFYNVFKNNNPLIERSPTNCDIQAGDGTQWRYREYQSRLAYSWVLLDQEISIFYDDNPVLPIVELEIALPQCDNVWLENTAPPFPYADYGSDGFPTGHPGVFPRQFWQHSLSDLFQLFLEDKVDHLDEDLQVLHMRLLLYPIQTLVCHRCQIIECLPQTDTINHFSRAPLETSSAIQHVEIRRLLKRWYDIMNRLQAKKSTRNFASKHAALIIYHLINLNICISIPEIERISRDEKKDDMNRTSTCRLFSHFDRFIYAREEALMHCGQVLRLMKELHIQIRPLWSSLAIYRVAIVLWAISNSIPPAMAEPTTQSTSGLSPAHTNSGAPIAIDISPEEETPWRRLFSKHTRGRPCLTSSTGQLVQIDDTRGILAICTQLVTPESPNCHLAEGVARKLRSLWVPAG